MEKHVHGISVEMFTEFLNFDLFLVFAAHLNQVLDPVIIAHYIIIFAGLYNCSL